MASFICIREGMKLVDSLSVLNYVIGFLPMIKILKVAYHDITQPWYYDNTSALSAFDNIGSYFNSLKRFGPGCGYYPETLKIFLIVHLYNFGSRKDFGLRHEFKV